MTKEIKFEGVAYDKAALEAMAASETAFAEAMDGAGFKHHFPGENRAEKVRALYALIAPKVDTAPAGDAPQSTNGDAGAKLTNPGKNGKS